MFWIFRRSNLKLPTTNNYARFTIKYLPFSDVPTSGMQPHHSDWSIQGLKHSFFSSQYERIHIPSSFLRCRERRRCYGRGELSELNFGVRDCPPIREEVENSGSPFWLLTSISLLFFLIILLPSFSLTHPFQRVFPFLDPFLSWSLSTQTLYGLLLSLSLPVDPNMAE